MIYLEYEPFQQRIKEFTTTPAEEHCGAGGDEELRRKAKERIEFFFIALRANLFVK
jgi:hypothetical protein